MEQEGLPMMGSGGNSASLQLKAHQKQRHQRQRDMQAVFVQSEEERRAVYRLRYQVYIAEQGKAYAQANHADGLLRDGADDYLGACLMTVEGEPQRLFAPLTCMTNEHSKRIAIDLNWTSVASRAATKWWSVLGSPSCHAIAGLAS